MIVQTFLCACLLMATGTQGTSSDAKEAEKLESSEDMMLLSKLLEASGLSVVNEVPENSLEDGEEILKKQAGYALQDVMGGGRLSKRADLMDYGFGGGRFGKRYDPFSVGGRFGKRYDPFAVGGRFGKRYDRLSVGGRFGKRYDPFAVGGRFGKRYDPFNVGGRFGKRSDGSAEDKRYDMLSVGGRFGRDVSHVSP